MNLLESLLTQDSQQEKRMRKYQKATMKTYISTPLWSNNDTVMDLVKVAASIIQQHYEQQEHYLCKVLESKDGLSCIHMV